MTRASGLGQLTQPPSGHEPMGAPRIRDLQRPDLSQGLCAKVDSGVFFPAWPTIDDDGSGRARYLAQTALAKDICHQCPVEIQCGAWAVDIGVDDGIWGGLDPEQRRILRRARRRQP